MEEKQSSFNAEYNTVQKKYAALVTAAATICKSAEQK